MISVCILTKNASQTLAKTLDSVQNFPEVILLDNGSTDDTLAIAKHYPNVRIETSPFIGFGPLRNYAATFAKNDWILALDSDEIISPLLAKEISDLQLSPNCVYAIPRRNFYNGKWIRGCGWHPDRVIRIYHKNQTNYGNAQVHESVDASNMKVVRLKNPLIHTPYLSTSDFLSKMQHYTTLFAEQNKGKKNGSFEKALMHALFALLKSYIFKGGVLDGKEGLIISLYNANTAFYKYLKLSEKNKKISDTETA